MLIISLLTEGKPAFIRNVEHIFSEKSRTPIQILIKADWPTPSWEHIDTSIQILENEKKVVISYLGLRRAGVALQQVTSFETSVEIILISKGEWSIIVTGRNENWESAIEIT